jgi:hypothetical protein
MSKWGEFEFSELKQFAKNLEQLQKEWPAFVESCVKELAGRLLAKVVPRTPVDSGELRRGWTVGQVRWTEHGCEIEVFNPVDYSLYVEYGHRTRDHKGWVEGRFMLTISEKELERELPSIMNRKLEAFLKKHLR